MKAALIAIGNSRGIRIPKPLIEQYGLEREVSLQATDKGLLISAPAVPRQGWEEAFRNAGLDQALPEPKEVWPPTRFDREEWEW